MLTDILMKLVTRNGLMITLQEYDSIYQADGIRRVKIRVVQDL